MSRPKNELLLIMGRELLVAAALVVVAAIAVWLNGCTSDDYSQTPHSLGTLQDGTVS